MLSEKPWRLDLVLRFIMALLLSIWGGGVVMLWLNSKHAPISLHSEFIPLLVGTLSSHGAALLLIPGLLREHEMTFPMAFGFAWSRTGRSLMLGIMIALLAMPIMLALGHLWAQLLNLIHIHTHPQTSVQMLQGSAPLHLRILIGVIAVLIAPLAEEMVFRGILYPTLKRYGLRRWALWGTAILFGAAHANWMTLLPLTVFGVVLALLYESTNNLLTPIVAHSFFNLVNFFLISPVAPT